MRVLLAIVAVAAALWGGWWFWNASLRERAVEDWLAERRAAGWQAEAASVAVQGFPNRLDLIVTALELADPEAEWSWSAPEFQVLSLTWKPHHFIAVWPGEQVFATPAETVRIASERLRGSVVFLPSPALALDRATVEIDALRAAGETGWEAMLDHAVLATRRAEGVEGHAYDVSFVAEGVALPASWTAGLERTGVLPPRMEGAEVEAVLVFDRPWDRHAIEGENPALDRVLVEDLRVNWGRLDLRGKGELTADAEGLAEGTIDLRVRNWREMLALATEAGLIGDRAAGAVEGALGLVARLSDDRNTIDVALAFEGGRTRIGPFPVGAAPRLTRD